MTQITYWKTKMKWCSGKDWETAIETIEIYDLTDEQAAEVLRRFEIAARETPWHSRWAYVAAHRLASELHTPTNNLSEN